MSTTTSAPPRTPATVLADARGLVAELTQTLWAARTHAELVDTVKQCELLKAAADAVELAAVAEVEATGAAADEGWGSTKDFVTAVAGGRRGHGGAMLRLAQALPACPRVREALAAGTITRVQAEVIARALDRLPARPGLRHRAEAHLLEQARRLDASDLAKAGWHLWQVVDPDGAEKKAEKDLDRQDRAAHLGRYLTLTQDGAGGVKIRGRTTVEDAAVIKAALLPLAAPQPAGQAGVCGGPTGNTGNERCEAGCAHDGRDPREHGTRFLDALVEACHRLADADLLPATHRTRPRLTITINLADLRAGLGTGLLDTGEELGPAAVRRLACDAGLIPAVLGTHGEVLDVGRTQRLVTPALWRALVLRDGHCTAPGCTRPPLMCDAHHLHHWADGGTTSLDNLALLCRRHHRMIHDTPWQIRLNPHDKRPEFLPPTELDPQRRPIRHRQPRE